MFIEYLHKVIDKENLSVNEMTNAVNEIMSGTVSDSKLAAFLTALRMKGETVDEICGATTAMLNHATHIDTGAVSTVDTCGTGGDGGNSYNISTTAAFITAGAGVAVAKHGNRAFSSKCGSADVLAHLGFNLDCHETIMEQAIQEIGIGFLFAPNMHPAAKYAAGVRKDLQMRTIFNMLGPLANPAGAKGQLIGVFDPVLTETFAEVLRDMGTKRAMVVHGHDGMDEITITAPTRITELNEGVIKTYDLYPEMLIGDSYTAEDIVGGDIATNAQIMLEVLKGDADESYQAIAIINAAAAIYCGYGAESLEEGIVKAMEAISNGSAYSKLKQLIEMSKY
ncbi:anthranilate phosphoribosyltransferase [Lentisphaerota bacterium WC36G]|nr:anthranilate phosphoribosyltransferase [Lentisphaerae bacterium WC36]